MEMKWSSRLNKEQSSQRGFENMNRKIEQLVQQTFQFWLKLWKFDRVTNDLCFKKLENTAGKIHGNIIQLFICYDLDLKKKWWKYV